MRLFRKAIKRSLKLGLILAVALLLSSCGHNAENPPSISVVQPLAYNIYYTGDTVPIRASISSDEYLETLQVELLSLTTGTTYLSYSYKINGLNYTVDTFWVNPLTDHHDVLVRFNAQNQSKGKAQKGVNIHCDPN